MAASTAAVFCRNSKPTKTSPTKTAPAPNNSMIDFKPIPPLSLTWARLITNSNYENANVRFG